jgi:hypothetical protein
VKQQGLSEKKVIKKETRKKFFLIKRHISLLIPVLLDEVYFKTKREPMECAYYYFYT